MNDTSAPERRASDAMLLKFEPSAFKSAFPSAADFAAGEIETIDLDAALPRGHEPFGGHLAEPPAPPPDAEENRRRLQLVKYKQTFEDFVAQEVSGVNFNDIKRGDVIEIVTIAGSLYFTIVDRIHGDRAGVGEILCQCRYDVNDLRHLVHFASITLPVFSKNHLLTSADGSQRRASRALKMDSDTDLPDALKNLLRETFFTGLVVHSHPDKEKLRAIDVLRWLKRSFLKIKALIDENNRREREKEARRLEARRQKQEEKQRRKEEKAGEGKR